MKSEDLFDLIGEADEQKVEAASKALAGPKKRPASFAKWGAVAACLGLLAAGSVYLLSPHGSDNTPNSLQNSHGGDNRPMLQWEEGFEADSYFKYCMDEGGMSSSSKDSKLVADAFAPYTETRYFSDFRGQMEADGTIPVMPDHPLYSCSVYYQADGSIVSVTFSWHQRGDTYSDLSITAAYQEVKQIQDCFEVDKMGNIIPPFVTVTERDGIRIAAEGRENRNKTMTFQTDAAWYQVAGSWNDSYAAVAELLDFVWEHPLDFSLFSMDKGVELVFSDLEAVPEAFSAYLPDFASFGYVRGENYLLLKDGEPYSFEGHYYSGVDEAAVKDRSYLQAEGWTEIHWCIDTKPDYYDLQGCLGDFATLTKQQVIDTLAAKSNFSFFLDGCFIKVYTKEGEEAWTLLNTLR